MDLEKLKKENEELQKENKLLTAWKEESLEVSKDLDLQKLGKLIGTELGHSVSKDVIPKVQNLLDKKANLIEALRYADRMLKICQADYDVEYIENIIKDSI